MEMETCQRSELQYAYQKNGQEELSLPPTREAFAESVHSAHVQTATWKAAHDPKPPSFDPTEYGWTRDEATRILMPDKLPTDVALAPTEILEMIKCG